MTYYPYTLTPLSEAEGGGWMITYPDLPGCVSDGATEAEAIENGRDAMEGWLAVAKEMGHPIPKPSSHMQQDYSGKFQLRIPKTLHHSLALRSKQEGVSLNQLCVSLLSYEMGRDDSHTS
jgi:antitoxin HicB